MSKRRGAGLRRTLRARQVAKEAEAISIGLQEIRKRRRISWVLFFGWPFVFPAVQFTLRWDELAMGMAGVSALAWVISGLRVSESKCPRCRQPFHGHIIINPWARKCMYCGLRLREKQG